MRQLIWDTLTLVSVLIFAGSSAAQSDEICGETGGSAWLNSPIVFGKVRLHGFDTGGKMPKITVTLVPSQRSEIRQTIDRSGNYCFRDVDGGGGTIVVDIEGEEVGRRQLPSSGLIKQHRQDFDLYAERPDALRAPGAISAKYSYPRNAKNAELFEKAAAAEKGKKLDTAAQLLKEIVSNDSADFIAWAKLASVYFDQNDLSGAESAFKKSIAAKPGHVPAMMNLGRIYLIQKNTDAAIEYLEQAAKAEPLSARARQLLGEAYLLARKGTLGVKALNEAIRLDPVGMAECHLLMARLYDLAGVKPLATREYKMFLEKVPEHPDKKKFERYINDNPDSPDK